MDGEKSAGTIKVVLPDSGTEPERNAEWKRFVTEVMMESEHWLKDGFETRVVDEQTIVIRSMKRKWFDVLTSKIVEFDKFLSLNGFRRRSDWRSGWTRPMVVETRFIHPMELKKPTSFWRMQMDEARDKEVQKNLIK